MKKHPGIFFVLWVIEIWFLLNLLSYRVSLQQPLKGVIFIAFYCTTIYGITYYHGRWVDNQMRRYNK